MSTFDLRVPWLLLLSVVTGLVDAASVLGLGRVFTANMTGNVVFLGFAAVGTPGYVVTPFVVALASFLAGAFVAGRVGNAHAGRSERRWLLIASGTEAILLWLSAIVALAFDPTTLAPTSALVTIIASTSFAMGFRNATVRQLKIADLTTTVLTLTLTGMAADSRAAGGARPNALRRSGAVLTILFGAALGAFLFRQFGLPAPLALAGTMALVGAAVCAFHPASMVSAAK